MIDIQHGPLGALEEDALAGPAGLIQPLPHAAGVGQDLRRDIAQLLENIFLFDLLGAEAAEKGIVVKEKLIEPCFEARGVRQITDANRTAPYLVFVGRADAPPGGADLVLALGFLQRRVEVPVKRQDERCILGHHQGLGCNFHTLCLDGFDLLDQRPGVHHHAIADDR